jgi:hypothetical protein
LRRRGEGTSRGRGGRGDRDSGENEARI